MEDSEKVEIRQIVREELRNKDSLDEISSFNPAKRLMDSLEKGREEETRRKKEEVKRRLQSLVEEKFFFMGFLGGIIMGIVTNLFVMINCDLFAKQFKDPYVQWTLFAILLLSIAFFTYWIKKKLKIIAEKAQKTEIELRA